MAKTSYLVLLASLFMGILTQESLASPLFIYQSKSNSVVSKQNPLSSSFISSSSSSLSPSSSSSVLDDHPADISICSSENAIYAIDVLSIDPNPPRRGQKLSILVDGNIRKRIEAGTIEVKVQLGIITLLRKDFDLCEVLHNELGKDCPLEEGKLELRKDVDLPNEIPPGRYKVHLYIKSNNDEEVGCVNAEFSMAL